MKKFMLLFVVFTAIMTLGCSSSSSSDDSLGNFNVASYTGVPLFSAELYALDASDPDRELTLYGVIDYTTSTCVNFNLEITELPETETTYMLGSGLNYCEVEVAYNDANMTGYAGEMDYVGDTESWVTIRKSGSNYTITFSVYVGDTYDDHLTGSYTGPVSVSVGY